MHQWWQVILEWVNCLDILDVKITDKLDLQDGYIYKKIIELIGVWKADDSVDENTNQVINFIKEEYPEFITNDHVPTENNDIQIASLFLLRASQEPEFQKPMSRNLQNNTQIKIKMFLEIMLPYGRHITNDIIDMAISELMDENPIPPNRTPKKRPLREFFTSPAAMSAQKQRIVNERDRQIRHLQSELETERCEKVYLQDDLKTREEKIKDLQAKLQIKNDELKNLRTERMNPYTPQSCKKTKDNLEIVYKKEVESLENYIAKLQKDCEKVETEKEELRQKILKLKIKLESTEKKSNHFEEQSEMLLAQMELKEREIVDLRMQNEEYRNLLKEMKTEEQSFECDDISYNKNRKSLNFSNSEVMSSVIDVQLLEMKEECGRLNLELEKALSNLNDANTENRGLRFTNDILKEKVEHIDQVAQQFRCAEEKLKVKIDEVSKLETELMVLSEELKHAKDQIMQKDKSLQDGEQCEKALKNELNKLTARLQILEENMQAENKRTVSLKSMLSTLEQEKVILSEKLQLTESSLSSKEVLLKNLEESERNLKNELNKFTAKTKVLEESLKKEEIKSEELAGCLSSLETDNLVLLEKSKVVEKQLLHLEESLKRADLENLNLNREVKNLNELLSSEKCSNENLNIQVSKLEQERQSLQHLNCKLTDVNAQLQNEKEDILTSLKNTEQNLTQERNLLIESNNLISELKRKCDDLQESYKSTENLIKTEKHSSDVLRTENEILKKENLNLLEKNETTEREVITLNELLTQAKQNIEQRNKDNINLENSMRRMEEFLAGERSEKAYLHTLIEKLENREQSLSNNLNVVKAELNEKLHSLLSSIEETNKMKSEMINLESKCQSLEEKLKVEELTVNNLRNTLSQMEKEHKNITAENSKYKVDINHYEDLIMKLNNENDILKKELSDLNEYLREEKCQSKDLQNSNIDLRMQTENLLKTVEKSELLIQEYEKNIKEYQMSISVMDKDIMSKDNELKTYNEQIIKLNESVINLEQSIREKDKYIDAMRKTVLENEYTLNESIKSLKDIALEGSQLIESNFNIYSNITIENLCEELRMMMASIKTLNNIKDDSMCKKEEEFNQTLSSLNKIQKENVDFKEKINDMFDEISRKEELLSQSEERESQLQRRLENVQGSLSNQIEELQNKLLKMEEENSTVIAELCNNKLTLETKLSNSSQELSSAISHNTELQKEQSLLQDEIMKLSKELSDNQEQNTIIRNEKLQLKEQLSQCSKELAETHSKNKLMENQISQLERLKSQQDCKILSIQAELNQTLQNLIVLDKAEKMLKEQIESLEKEKLESKLKLKEVFDDLQTVNMQQNVNLETQYKLNKEKDLRIEELCKNVAELELSLAQEKEHNLVLNNKYQMLENNLKTEKNNAKELKKNLNQCHVELKDSQNKYCQVSSLYNEIESNYLKLHLAITNLDTNISNSLEDKLENCLINKIMSSITMITMFKKSYENLLIKNQDLRETLSSEKAHSEHVEAENVKLREEMEQFKLNRKKFEELICEILKKTELFQMLLSLAMKLRYEFDMQLNVIKENWTAIKNKYEPILVTNRQSCDRLQQLVLFKEELDKNITELRYNHFKNAHFLLEAMHKSILWTEKKLKNSTSSSNEDNFESLHDVFLNESFSSDESVVNADIERNKQALQKMQSVKDDIESFINLVETYDEALKNGEIKLELVQEEKLKIEIEKSNKEKKDLKDKLDNMRTRNAKLEKNIDGLRVEVRLLKEGQLNKVDSSEIDNLNKKISHLEKEKEELKLEKERLETNKDDLEKVRRELEKSKEELEKDRENVVAKHKEELTKKNTEFEERLKEVHNEYGAKLDVLKQKMKTAYNEEVTKIKQEQEKIIEDRIKSLRTKMEQQCRKHTDEISKYKDHVSELSTQYWDVGEKLIFEKQEKEQALQQLKNLKGKMNENKSEHLSMIQKTLSLDRREFPHDFDSFKSRSGHTIRVIEEETVSRRHSVRSIQAMGNPFNAEDEEGEIFDNNYLTDMKEGRQRLPAPDLDRLSVLQRRNTLCKPHLKSSYPAETQFQAVGFSEEEIKTGGGSDEIFNDSLSQSLLPGQKPRKKDRTQPSYKKPGPPTPSKNGGRLSLQGNELPRSPTSKILKERNADRKTNVTPKRLKDFFSTSKKQDENGTPRSRRLSIFRKQRPATDKI